MEFLCLFSGFWIGGATAVACIELGAARTQQLNHHPAQALTNVIVWPYVVYVCATGRG